MADAPVRAAGTEPVVDAAAFWCMRLHDETCSNEDREAFERWLASDPAHAAEYQAMLEIWMVSGTLPRRNVLDGKRQVPTRSVWGRSTLAAAASLAIAAVLGWSFGLLPDTYDRHHTHRELRDVTLADGSEVKLNRGTSLIYLGFRNRRQVLLDRGEAFSTSGHTRTPYTPASLPIYDRETPN